MIADIHFQPQYVFAAIDAGCAAVRVNPGNIKKFDDQVKEIARAAADHGTLDPDRRQRRLARPAAAREVRQGHPRGARRVARCGRRASSRSTASTTSRSRSSTTTRSSWSAPTSCSPRPATGRCTSASPRPARRSRARSSPRSRSARCCSKGIGDTIRVSLSAPPVEEVKVGLQILESLNLRPRRLEIVSCPSCGRAQVDVYKLAEQVTAGLDGLEVPLRVAVMGCVVNGPGEAREADLGVASGNGKGQIFVKGEVIKTVPESQIVETLIEEAMRIAEEMEPVEGGRRHGVRRLTARSDASRTLGSPACSAPSARCVSSGPADLARGHARCSRRDPVVNVVAAYRARTTQLEPRWLGGEMWGYYADGGWCRSATSAANLVPAMATARRRSTRSPSGRCARAGRARRSSGPPEAVGRCGSGSPSWGPARERPAATSRTSRSTARRWSRPTRRPARPHGRPRRALPGLRRDVHRGGRRLARGRRRRGLYRARVAQLVARGWSFARIEDGRVVFKAEVAARDAARRARCRASGSTRSCAARGWRRRDGGGGRARAARRRAGGRPSTSTTTTTAARRSTSGSASAQTATFATVMF